MQWFVGNVQTAIQISRKNQALLIVYVTNDTEDGRLFDGFWDQIDSANLLCPVVGIKLKDGETAAQQFADIYPTPILPAAYLINQLGEPLEVITPLVGKEYDQFRARFNKAVEQFLKNAPKPAPVVAPEVPRAPEATASAPEARSPAPEAPRAPEVAAPAPEARAPAPAPQIDPNLAEKVARAKELLRIKKEKEAEQKRINEKTQKEELRKAQLSREEHQEKALIEAAKQRKKEKLDAGKEKERILAQIKADREDAKKRFGKAENDTSAAPEQENKAASSVGKAIPSDRCRLQVRLPDGSTFVEEFPSNDVLNSLVEIIRQKPIITGAFEVSQTYPRRVFSLDDYSKTFLDNQLTPSSALVVVQKSASTFATPSAIIATSNSVFSLLFSPFLLIWNLLSGWFGGVASTGSAAAAAKNSQQPSGAGPQNPGAARARGMPRVAEVRRRGNVAGLENHNDDDPEERANFNGNSTQFM